MVKKIYFIISFVLEVFLILFMLFLCAEEIITTKSDYLLAVPIIIVLILYSIISMKAFISSIREPEKKVPVKPKLDECIYMKPSKHKYIKISDEIVEAEYMYLPPLCAKKLEDTEHKLRSAIKFVKANGVTPEICYSLRFCEDKEHNIISMVPNRIIIRDLNDSSWSKFVFDVYVWE